MKYLNIVITLFMLEALVLSCKNKSNNDIYEKNIIEDFRDSLEKKWIEDSCGCLGYRTEDIVDKIIENRNLEGKDTGMFVLSFGNYYVKDSSRGYTYLTYILNTLCRNGLPVNGSDKTYIVFMFYNNCFLSEKTYIIQE